MYKQLNVLNELVIGQRVVNNEDEKCFSLCKTCEDMSRHYFNSNHLECSVCCPLDMKMCAYKTSPIIKLKEKLNKELNIIDWY